MKEKKAQAKNTRARLGEFMGHSIVAVIRAMGKAGWSFLECRDALNNAKLTPAEQTIRIQLAAGRKGVGKPAEIEPKALEALRPKSVEKAPSRAEKPASGKPDKAPKAKSKAKK